MKKNALTSLLVLSLLLTLCAPAAAVSLSEMSTALVITDATPSVDMLAAYGYAWDASTQTLTLDKMSIDNGNEAKSALKVEVEGTLTIIVKGENSVTGSRSGYVCAKLAADNIILTGGGTLNISKTTSAGLQIVGTLLVRDATTLQVTGQYYAISATAGSKLGVNAANLIARTSTTEGIEAIYGLSSITVEYANIKAYKPLNKIAFAAEIHDGSIVFASDSSAAKNVVISNTGPYFTMQPEDGEIPVGGTVALCCTAAGDGVTYGWKLNDSILTHDGEIGGVTVSGYHTNRLTVSLLADSYTLNELLKFSCVATDSAGASVESAPAYLKIVSHSIMQISITQQPVGAVIELNEHYMIQYGGSCPGAATMLCTVYYNTENSYSGGSDVGGGSSSGSTFSGGCAIYSNTAGITYWYVEFTALDFENEVIDTAYSDIVEIEVVDPDDPGTPEAPYVFPFTDVADSSWYRNDVEIAHKSGLVNGTTATTYSPDNNMSYAEAIKLAACMYQLYHDGAVTLSNGSPYWYSSYVSFAQDHGIIDGAYPDYNAEVTREEFVHIFYNALPATEYGDINSVADGAIPDVPMTRNHAGEIYGFYRAGILIGSDSSGTFNPLSNIHRSEVAAILTRMFDSSQRKSITLS